MRRLTRVSTLGEYLSEHLLRIAITPGAQSRRLRGAARDDDAEWLVRVECPFKAGAPYLLARVSARSHLVRVVNVPARTSFTCPLHELADAARRSASTFACQRWQHKLTLRLRRWSRDIGMRLAACRRNASPLAGSMHERRTP